MGESINLSYILLKWIKTRRQSFPLTVFSFNLKWSSERIFSLRGEVVNYKHLFYPQIKE